MYKVRLSFYKKSYAKFVSHLDLMRMFQRIFRIAGVDVTFSQGFNPHPKMSIAHPLPVGATSDEEYLDIQVDSKPDYNELVNRINGAMPQDIKIISAWEPVDSMNEISLAKYTVKLTLVNRIGELDGLISSFCSRNDIIIEKKTKKGVSDTDIKPMIKSIELSDVADNNVVLKFIISIGEKANLKASSVLDAMEKYIPGFEILYCDINRDLLLKENMTKIDV